MAEGRGLAVWAARVLEAGWLVAAVAVPLAFNPWGHSGFELPKTLLLRGLVILMGLGALVSAGERLSGSSPPSPRGITVALAWPVLALGVVTILATLLSVDRRVSLWGSYERQQGLLTLLSYLTLFALTAANLRTSSQFERLWAALVWGSAPVVVYGLVQALGLDPLAWQTDAVSPVLSTVGRANFLGSYLVLVIPLTVRRVLSSARRWPPGLLLSAQILCLALTQARGAWVGFGVATVAGLLVWAAVVRDRRPALAALALVVFAIGFVGLLNVPGGPLTLLADLPGLDRLATVTDTESGSSAARVTIWTATLPLIVDRPWLGYGPETMRPVFAAVFPPELIYYQGRHVTVDRAHNLWLDLGMSVGLAGIASVGALVVGFGLLAWRGLRAGSSTPERVVWVCLVAAVSGHLADLQFGFELTASGTVFWLLLALAAGPGMIERPIPLYADEERGEPGGMLDWLPYLLPALLALVLILLVCVRPLLADVAYQRALGAASPSDRLEASLRAVRLWPLEPQYLLNLAFISFEVGDSTAVASQLAAARRLSPRDPRIWAAHGEVYEAWSELDPEQLLQAEMAYRRALELAPDVAAYHAALGSVLARQGRLEEGVEELERAVDLDATYAWAYRHLADLYLVLGRETDAGWAQREAIRWSTAGGDD